MVASDDMDAISPSAVKTFELCPRKWALRAIDKREVASGPAAALGQDVHKQMELWLSQKQHPDHTVLHGRIAEAALHHWPDPAVVTFATEFHVNAELDGIDFHGYQDVGFYDPHSERYVVGDHKSTGDFRWSLDENTLATDPQGLVYALAAMQRERVEEVELRWVYMKTKGAHPTRPVTVVVDRNHVETTLREHVIPVARLMKKAREEAQSALDLPQNPNACGDFGGCPFVDDCALTPMQRMKAAMAHQSLKDKLAAAKAAQKGVSATAKATPDTENPEVPGANINPPEGKGAGALAAKLTGATAPPAASPPKSLKDRLSAAKAAAPVTTAEAPKEAPSGAATCARCGSELMETPTGTVCPRWKAHKAEDEAPPPAPKVERHDTPNDGETRGFILLIDCGVMASRLGGNIRSVQEVIDIPHRALCEAKKVLDYRQIEFTHAGDLLSAVSEYLDEQEPLQGIILADRGYDADRVVLPWFEKRAALVIRALSR